MTRESLILLVIGLLQLHVAPSRAGRINRQVLPEEVDIALTDDFTKEITTEEPLLKKCVVDGNAYTHSQTIPSYDANSHCLCVAGEVYCWWQNFKMSNGDSSATTGSNFSPSYEESSDSSAVNVDQATGDSVDFLEDSAASSIEANSSAYSSSTSSVPATCLVMGREYREGEVLPHSTGNCVECSCGSEGRVECSPRDCVALRPEIPVAADVSNIPSAPDADFELFDLARDRAIDDGF